MKKGLGKGLGAFFSDEDFESIIETKNDIIDDNKNIDADEYTVYESNILDEKVLDKNEKENQNQNAIIEVKLNDIEPNVNQPRKYFNEEELQELAESIKEHGVIQPLIVTKKDNKYLIVTGERRWRASRIAGLKTVPVIVKEFAGRKLMEVSIIENLQREDLNPIEEAEAIQRLLDEYELTQEEVAKSVGKSRSTVSNMLRILNLDDRVKDMVISGKISSGHAKTLVTLNKEVQYIIAKELEKKILSVRETEEYIKKILAKNSIMKDEPKNNTDSKIRDIERDISARLKEALGTKVQLKANKNKGKIIIDYYSNEELERLLDMFYSIK